MEKNPIRWTQLNIRIKEFCLMLGYRIVIEDDMIKLISVDDSEILMQFDNHIDNEWDSLELKIHQESSFLIKESELHYSKSISMEDNILHDKYNRIVEFYNKFENG